MQTEVIIVPYGSFRCNQGMTSSTLGKTNLDQQLYKSCKIGYLNYRKIKLCNIKIKPIISLYWC